MTRTRGQQKQEGSSESDGTATGSDRPGTAECLPGVRKLMGMYSTPIRKGVTSSIASGSRTPASTSRRMGPPRNVPATPRSALRTNNTDTAGYRPLVLREFDPVEVYCRVKPLVSEIPSDGCIRILNDTTIALIPPETSASWRLGTAKESHYTFQTVFNEDVAQKSVFDSVSLPLVQDFLQGKNALLFAYGVTGSGKTYTMSGTANECGIMPRCLDVIFNSISKYKATKYVFKPDRMNGFESQAKSDAILERQKEITDRLRETGRTPKQTRYGRSQQVMDTDQYTNRVKDETTVPLKTTDSLYSVFVTYVEIYNNFVYDLLDESPIEMTRIGKTGLQSKMLREDINHNVYVNGVTEVEVESPEDAFEVFQRGQRRRRMAHTALNTESSRSHSIFNIRLVQAPTDCEGDEVAESKEQITVSQLSLVDLAGSERCTRTQATGDRLKEAGNINNSLMTLRKCIDILRENQQSGANRIVPYRDSKLTHFLKNYFEGEGRVRMVLCINPRNEDYDENIHVLTFAELTQEVQIHRPQEKKQVEMMTPGRHKANELYKEATKQLIAEKIIQESDLPPSDVEFVFGLGYPIPLFKMTKSHEAELLANLKKALEFRVKGQAELTKVITEKRNAFRKRLVTLERDNNELRFENSSIKTQMQQINQEKSKQDNVLREMIQERAEWEIKAVGDKKHLTEIEGELATLKMEVRQRDLIFFKEKRALMSDMDLQRELDDLKNARQLQREGKKLKDKYKNKEKTLAAVRQLVSAIDIPADEGRSRSRRSRSFGLINDSLSSTSSEPDLLSAVKSSRSTRSRAPSAPLLTLDTPPSGFFSHTKRSGVVSNSRRPRARSTDKDIWIEHTAGISAKGGTVFQPCMKQKKSVSKLTKAEDLSSKASKYCLRTQEQDSEGELETRLYKGDVLQTIGGGAQVVFNDVEVLRQESPTGTSASPSRKRRSSTGVGLVTGSPFRNRSLHFGDHPEDIADKCKTGVIHNSGNKKSRHN